MAGQSPLSVDRTPHLPSNERGVMSPLRSLPAPVTREDAIDLLGYIERLIEKLQLLDLLQEISKMRAF